MKRLVLTLTAGATMALGSVSAAGADHTGCAHARTAQAHASVPHLNEGTHTAHQSIPYCPPEEAPRHG